MSESGQHTLALELPSSLLGSNDYVVKLDGIRRNAGVQEIAAYSFRVVKH